MSSAMTDGRDSSVPTSSERQGELNPAANASASRLLKNFVANYLSFAAAVLLSVVLTPVVLHHAGVVVYGLWVALSAVGAYVGLLDAGVSTAAVREVAAALALGDEDRLNSILDTVNVFFVLTGLLACLVTLAIVPFVGDFVKLPPGTLEAARVALVIKGATTTVGFVRMIPSVGLYGSGRADINAYLGAALVTLTQGSQIAVTLLGGGLIGLFATSLGCQALALAASWVMARRLQVGRRFRLHVKVSVLRELVSQGWQNTLLSISGIVSYALDALVLAVLLPISQLAAYDIALSTANLAGNLSTTGTSLLVPTYAHSNAVDDAARQFKLFTRAVLASSSIALAVSAALVAYGQELMSLWLGKVPAHTYEILVVMNLVFLVRMPGRQAAVYLAGIGKVRLISRMALSFAVINLGLTVGATMWLGVIGPVVGSVPQVVIFEFAVLPKLCCRELGVSFRSYAKAAIAPLGATFLAAVTASLTLKAWLPDSTLWAPVGSVVIVLVSVSALVVYLWSHDLEVKVILTRYARRVAQRG